MSREDRNPPRLIIYTQEGVGKTTLASQTPNPCFISTEDGEGDLVTKGFPTITTFREILEAIAALVTQKHDYQTVVFDNISKMQNIIHDEIREKFKGAKGGDVFANYGKGYKMAIPYFLRIVRGINALKQKGMMVIVLGHAEIVRYEPPDTDPYDKFFLNLNKMARDMLFQECDGMFFGGIKIFTTSGDEEKKARGTTDGSRFLVTQERPTQQAKCRYRSVPYEMEWKKDFDWNGFLSKIGRPPPWNRSMEASNEDIAALNMPSESELAKAAEAKVAGAEDVAAGNE